jgi:predicted deacylase
MTTFSSTAALSLCVIIIQGGLLAGCAAPNATAPPVAHAPPAATSFTAPIPETRQQEPSLRQIGTSVRGTPIMMEVIGDGGQQVPALLVLGGTHGDEGNSSELALLLAEHLRSHPELAAGRRIAIAAAVNPDGLAIGSRYNAHRVDLNRNFPSANWSRSSSSGPQAASEPETRAVIEAIDTLRPACIVSIHSIIGPPCNNYDGPGQSMAEAMSRLNQYPAKATIGYPTPGSLGNWAGVDRSIPTITLELPRNLSGADAWERNREALLWVVAHATITSSPTRSSSD